MANANHSPTVCSVHSAYDFQLALIKAARSAALGKFKPTTARKLRRRVEATVARLIDVLDALDAPDEDREAQGDEEPSLGAPECDATPLPIIGLPGDYPYYETRDSAGSQIAWAKGDDTELEEVCEDEGAQCEGEGDMQGVAFFSDIVPPAQWEERP